MLCKGEITEPLPQKYTYTKMPFARYNCYGTISRQEWKTLKIGKCSEDGNFTYIGGRLSQRINFEILEFVLGFESWGDKTKKKNNCVIHCWASRRVLLFYSPLGHDANLAYDL